MKKLVYILLNRFFGKKQFYRVFLVLKNIGLEGLNYRNADIKTNGEIFLITQIARYYRSAAELILLDVGANVGNYSKTLAGAFNEKSLIYSFEPFSTPYSKLEEVALQHQNIKPNKLGLSDKEEELTIYSNDEFSEVGGVYNRNLIPNKVSFNKKELNRFTTIDLFAKENKISHIHFLKIDVEGHEFAVLKGATELLEKRKIDFIQFEFGSGNYFSKTYFFDFYALLSPNYNLYKLLKNGSVEIKEYNADLEMQILSNFVAIDKRLAADFFTQANDS
jgi:FkbM family methyltransferase